MNAASPPSRLSRFIPLLVLLAGLAAFFALGLEHQLTLEALKTHRDSIEAWVSAHPVLAAASFVGFYTLIVACSIPAASLLTLAGGFLFGVWEGTALVVIGATLGATVIFLAAKTALHDLLRERFGETAKKMEAGFRANAFNYLLVLRLVPLFPFFLVNLAAGLLGVPLSTYVLATFLGIIPGTFVYVGLGNGLGTIFASGATPDLSLIFKPEILLPILGLAVLSLVPVFFRKAKA
ncbi:MAG TPA: TVP38/TMEM64 family protein [Rhizomicrobium sp.]|nr:TVP38/TMEM64 family protein [Rhizomicrobium sp.]